MYEISEINTWSQEDFVTKVGWVFEHSPWISNGAWEKRPFQSLKNLFDEMEKVVQSAPKEKQLDLIRAHPDLGGRLKMTESSVKEQNGAGLDQLSEEEYLQFSQLNKKYMTTFQFPFILAVKGHNKDSIYQEMEKRVNNEQDIEFQTALNEISKIAYFRLEGIVQSNVKESMK